MFVKNVKKITRPAQTFSSLWCLFNSSWWSGEPLFFASSSSLLAFILCSHFLFSKALWSSLFPSCDTLLTETQRDFMIYVNNETEVWVFDDCLSVCSTSCGSSAVLCGAPGGSWRPLKDWEVFEVWWDYCSPPHSVVEEPEALSIGLAAQFGVSASLRLKRKTHQHTAYIFPPRSFFCGTFPCDAVL